MIGPVFALLLAAVAGSASAANPVFNLTLAEEMNTYAGAAYCNASQLFAWDCLVCKNSWSDNFQVVSIITNTTTDTHAYTGVNSRTKQVVLSFRGTHDIHEFITDLDFDHIPFVFPGAPSSCEVHKGFHADFMSVLDQVLADFGNLIEQYPTYSIFVTGHSLGAALATFGSLYIKHAYPTKVINHLTFGQPRVGNQDFATFFDGYVTPSWRVTHYRDIVPHLPPESFDFYHIVNEAWQTEQFKGMSSMTLCYTGESKSCADQFDVALSVDDHLVYLGQPQGGAACCNGC